MKISVVRFVDAPLIGREMDPRRSLSSGERIPSGEVKLSRFDSTFLRVDFVRADGNNYAQLVPWGQVGTVLFEDAEPEA